MRVAQEQSLLFVFRKPNKGNFSIEKIYHLIFKSIQNRKDDDFHIEKFQLKSNFDLLSFIQCFLNSLVTKKKVVHITGGCSYMVLAFPFMKRVLTIHDFYHYQNKQGFQKFLYDTFFYKLPIRYSHKIVVVSENTKNELIRLFAGVEKKVEVLHNPLVISDEDIINRKRFFLKDVPVKILQIGDKALKNYDRLLQATSEMLVTYSFVHSNPEKINELLTKYKCADRAEVHSNISDEQLYELYSDSDVLFFASEAEGFGLPIIEAQAFGLPVITSNIPPMSDVGIGAILVDPYSVPEITRAFLNLFQSEIQHENYDLASNNVKQYKLETVVSNYLEFYKTLA